MKLKKWIVLLGVFLIASNYGKCQNDTIFKITKSNLIKLHDDLYSCEYKQTISKKYIDSLSFQNKVIKDRNIVLEINYNTLEKEYKLYYRKNTKKKITITGLIILDLFTIYLFTR